MKKHTLGVSLAAGVALLLLAAPSSYAERAFYGQSPDHGSVGVPGVVWSRAPEVASVTVPFVFAAGDEVLQPGKYTVTVDSDDPTVVRLVSADGRHVATLVTQFGSRIDQRSSATFAFRRYGRTDYVLSSVGMPGDSLRRIPTTRSELTEDLAKLAMIRYESQHRG
jgi:hypothetical protein